MVSTLTWRVFSGLSHLQETRIVGKFEADSASDRSVGIFDSILRNTHLELWGSSWILSLFMTSYNNKAPSMRGTI